MPLNAETRGTIYAGVNFIFSPPPALDGTRFIDVQAAFENEGVEFGQVAKEAESQFLFQRSGDLPLQVELSLPGGPVGQLVVRAPELQGSLELFRREAQSVCDAVFDVWTGEKQLVRRDATIRQLYDAAGQHAFAHLWTERLGQSVDGLQALERKVHGGGLRLVIPPEPAEDPTQIEIKVESFFRDLRKLWLQVTIAWPQAMGPIDRFDPGRLLSTVENYANTQVFNFLNTSAEGEVP